MKRITSKANIFEILSPASDEDLNKLTVGDMVCLTGVVHTLRDAGYERLLNTLSKGKSPPVDFKHGAVWHCGPIVNKTNEGWMVIAAGPTTSSRFTSAVSEICRRLNVKIVVGKGPIGREAVEAFSEVGGVYLATTGGAAAYYASQVEGVYSVHWLDLGTPAALWSMRINRMGPLIVAVDSHGGDLFLKLSREVNDKIKKIYSRRGIDPSHRYVWWPKNKDV